MRTSLELLDNFSLAEKYYLRFALKNCLALGFLKLRFGLCEGSYIGMLHLRSRSTTSAQILVQAFCKAQSSHVFVLKFSPMVVVLFVVALS